MQSLLVDSLKSGGTAEQFREKYIQADVLLVDDIQELVGKEAIQDELILLFNSFFESEKRFMMTSSQRKHDMEFRIGWLFVHSGEILQSSHWHISMQNSSRILNVMRNALPC